MKAGDKLAKQKSAASIPAELSDEDLYELSSSASSAKGDLKQQSEKLDESINSGTAVTSGDEDSSPHVFTVPKVILSWPKAPKENAPMLRLSRTE